MKRTIATAALGAALFAALPAFAAEHLENYRTSLQCVSLHIIAGQVLKQDENRGSELAASQAGEAADYFAFAQASRPALAKAEVDVDLSAQMDADYSRITAPGANIDAFLRERVPMCKALKRKM